MVESRSSSGFLKKQLRIEADAGDFKAAVKPQERLPLLDSQVKQLEPSSAWQSSLWCLNAFYKSHQEISVCFDRVQLAIGRRGHVTKYMRGSTVHNQNKTTLGKARQIQRGLNHGALLESQALGAYHFLAIKPQKPTPAWQSSLRSPSCQSCLRRLLLLDRLALGD